MKHQEVAEPVAGEKESSAITWGPATAVLGTVAIYLGAQVLAYLVFSYYAGARNLNGEALEQWFNGTNIQFAYILFVEALSLGLLWQILRLRHATFKTLGLIKPKLRDIGYALMGFGIYFPVLIVSTILISILFPQLDLEQKQQIGFEAARTSRELIIVFISLVVLPPITEEILVRGFLYLGLRARWKKIIAIFVTSAIFAVAHLQFGNGEPLLWPAAIDTFILSVVLIYLREKTGALWASIGLHMIKNGIAFTALFVIAK